MRDAVCAWINAKGEYLCRDATGEYYSPTICAGTIMCAAVHLDKQRKGGEYVEVTDEQLDTFLVRHLNSLGN